MYLYHYEQAPGYFPEEDEKERLYWLERAKEEEWFEYVEYSNACAHEEELALREYSEAYLEDYELNQAS